MTHANITVNGVEYTPVVDKWKDLKQAFAEGAIIEYWNTRTEEYLDGGSDMTWSPSSKYRIKGGISIDSWNKHKDLIKQFWDGAEIEVRINKDNWASFPSNPNWNTFEKYRVKQDKWKLPEYKDGRILSAIYKFIYMETSTYHSKGCVIKKENSNGTKQQTD